jgi:hypothetical protein
MTDSEKIEQLLSQLQSEGRSSPAGQSWGKFHAFLSTHQSEKSGRPPLPLILAASGESNATKHSRLRDQLDWAAAQGLLPAALAWLDSLSPTEWNTCSSDHWNKTSHGWD